ncbi:hypothetical protein M4W13_07430 [Citrobacter cronae]|uniref:hypothetical protein n=1 Tax=Citrobacter cronae TaxID=1748967 RepID=UPI002078778A|nr:hypothetical protein [Citrobacter cronae]MCM8841868.1 hypothetical protein [Citrobacter cronae]
MKVVANMLVVIHGKGVYTVLHKEIDTPLVPVAGMEYEDSTFNNPVKIISVTCNFDDHYYYVTLPMNEFNNDDAAKAFVDMTELHGWTKP